MKSPATNYGDVSPQLIIEITESLKVTCISIFLVYEPMVATLATVRSAPPPVTIITHDPSSVVIVSPVYALFFRKRAKASSPHPSASERTAEPLPSSYPISNSPRPSRAALIAIMREAIPIITIVKSAAAPRLSFLCRSEVAIRNPENIRKIRKTVGIFFDFSKNFSIIFYFDPKPRKLSESPES